MLRVTRCARASGDSNAARESGSEGMSGGKGSSALTEEQRHLATHRTLPSPRYQAKWRQGVAMGNDIGDIISGVNGISGGDSISIIAAATACCARTLTPPRTLRGSKV